MALPDDGGGGSRPVPDPTLLTTEALMREVLALRELLEQRIGGLKELLNERIDGMAWVREREFRGIEDKLEIAERQRVEQKQDTKAAVDAALSAAKEAVKEQTIASERSIAKSEAATTKSIEQMGDTFTTALDGQRRETADLKDRITEAAARRAGTREAEGDGRERHAASGVTTGLFIAGSAVIVAIGGIITALIAKG